MKTKIEFLNPDAIHAPLGRYSHVAAIPAGDDLFFTSGQLGVRPDGSSRTSIEEQADLSLAPQAAGQPMTELMCWH